MKKKLLFLLLFTAFILGASQPELVIGFNGLPENQDFQQVEQYLNELGDLSGIQFRLVSLSRYQAVSSVLLSQIDGDILCSTSAYNKATKINTSALVLFNQNYYIFTHGAVLPPQKDEQLRTMPMISTRGCCVQNNWIDENMVFMTYAFMDDYTALQALAEDVGEYYIGPGYLKKYLNRINYEKEVPVTVSGDPLYSVPVYLVLNEKHNELYSAISSAVQQMAFSGRTEYFLGEENTSVASAAAVTSVASSE